MALNHFSLRHPFPMHDTKSWLTCHCSHQHPHREKYFPGFFCLFPFWQPCWHLFSRFRILSVTFHHSENLFYFSNFVICCEAICKFTLFILLQEDRLPQNYLFSIPHISGCCEVSKPIYVEIQGCSEKTSNDWTSICYTLFHKSTLREYYKI